MTLCGSASVFYIHTENWVLYSFKYDTLWRYFTSFSLLSIFSCLFQFFSLSHNEKSFHSTTGYIHWNAFIYSTFKIVNTPILKCIALWQMYTHLTFVLGILLLLNARRWNEFFLFVFQLLRYTRKMINTPTSSRWQVLKVFLETIRIWWVNVSTCLLSFVLFGIFVVSYAVVIVSAQLACFYESMWVCVDL